MNARAFLAVVIATVGFGALPGAAGSGAEFA